MKVAKWGNSLAIRIPASVTKALELKEGDEVDLSLTEPQGFVVQRKLAREEAIRALRKYRGMMPRGFKFDRDEANAR